LLHVVPPYETTTKNDTLQYLAAPLTPGPSGNKG
jgi:hypothetical protein